MNMHENGQMVEIKPREIEIYDLKLLNIKKESNEIFFRVSCSKGTYIRSLCEDIAEKLETVGYMKNLNRIQVGDFNIKNAISIDELENNYENLEFIETHFISIEELFLKKPEIVLKDKKLQLFLNGVQLTYVLKEGIYRIYDEKNNFIGIGIIKNNLLKRDIIVEA